MKATSEKEKTGAGRPPGPMGQKERKMSAQDQVFTNNSVALRTSQKMMKELRGKIRNEEEYAETSVKWLVMIAAKALDAFYYEGEDERNVIQFLMSDHSVLSVVQEAGIVTEATDRYLCPKF